MIPTITSNGIWRVLQVNGNPFLSTPIMDSIGQWCSNVGLWCFDIFTIRFVRVAFLLELFASSTSSEWRFPTEILGNFGISPKSVFDECVEIFHYLNGELLKWPILKTASLYWCISYLALQCVRHFSNPYLASPCKTLLEMAHFWKC